MIMMTAYIIIILNFATFVPCSCGEFIESQNWIERLICNIAFVLMALVALYLLIRPEKGKKIHFRYLCTCSLWNHDSGNCLPVVSQLDGKDNAFVRKYIQYGLEKAGDYI